MDTRVGSGMLNLPLLPNEEVIFSSDKDTLILTSMRIRYQSKGNGHSIFWTLMLDNVACCAIATRSHPLLILLALILGASGFLSSLEDFRGLLWIACILVMVAYAYTRSKILSIESRGGGNLKVPILGLGKDQTIEFVNEVERARLDFVSRYCKRSV